MNFAATSPRSRQLATNPAFSWVGPTANIELPACVPPTARKGRFNPHVSGEGRLNLSLLFRYSYKFFRPQPLSFDTHTNAPGCVATVVSSSFFAHSFSLFATSEKYLLSLQRVPHSLQKQPGCTQFVPNSWNDPLNWHSRDGHTLRERKHQWREGSDIPGSFSAQQ
jgi:hypothetical protein